MQSLELGCQLTTAEPGPHHGWQVACFQALQNRGSSPSLYGEPTPQSPQATANHPLIEKTIYNRRNFPCYYRFFA